MHVGIVQVRSINKMIRDEDCYKGLDSTVKSFTASLPLVGELRSPAMRARHWDSLMAATKKKIALDDPAFSLQQLLDLQVPHYSSQLTFLSAFLCCAVWTCSPCNVATTCAWHDCNSLV